MVTLHIPVMLAESISYLKVKKNSWYIDCNLGLGGHTEKILEMGGKVLGIDLDSESIKAVAKKHNLEIDHIDGRYRAVSDKLILCQSNFTEIKIIASTFLKTSPSGILFDLGLSSAQLDTASRGFSFSKNAPLDMRMDRSQSVTAADLVNGLYVSELSDLFWKYGEEEYAKPIAKRIVEERSRKRIDTTDELARIVLSVKRNEKHKKIHPATKVFQALRIAVNDELSSLEKALPEALDILQPFGRIVVISFHSLEDRIVKNFLKSEEDKNTLRIITKKPIEPTDQEIEINPRSRSAKLRAAEKI